MIEDLPEEVAGGWGPLSSLPGNPLMWVLIVSELLVFGAFLWGFAAARLLHPETFAAGRAVLDQGLGGLNTIILVSSGWCAAQAVQAERNGAAAAAIRRWLGGSAALGLAFLIVKGIEWSHEAALGHGLTSDVFFTLFFLMTGFHAAHVALGIVILAIVAARPSPENLETGTAFWHMVDLIWLLLFPIVYLTG